MTEWRNRILGSGAEPPDQLLANPANFRIHPKHQQDALAGVLSEVGWVQEVIVNQRTGHLIDGHLRVMLALREGAPFVPCKYVDLSPEEEALILATFDPIAALAAIDAAQLEALLDEVKTNDPALMAMIDEMAQEAGIVPGLEPGGGGDDFDATPAEGPTRTAVGDLWVIGGVHRLLVGDCTDPANVARLMGEGRADMAWCDPPFGIDLQPQRGLTDVIANDGNADARALWVNFLPLLCEYLKQDTVAFLCQDWSEFDWTLPLVREHFTIKSKVVWYKNNFGIGYYLRPQHEDVLYCWKGDPPKPVEAQSDVWEVARLNAPEHAAEKPIALMQRAIEFASRRGAVVADWFAGVGGTLIAAHRTNRRAYLCEIEPRHADVILRRAEAEHLTCEKVS